MDSYDLDSISFDVFRRDCASHTVLDMLSGKWTYLIVRALTRGRMRNSELARKIEGISPKMLSQTLRELERDGLVVRRVHAEVPPRVDYALTPLGEELAGLMGQICDWAERHVPEVLRARLNHGMTEEEARTGRAAR
ncbi:transcriptional regulator [Primorskyibacter flagellatus]|uniref:Transcriptional regulator n=1 Tax=Primorskyibacter flagellatus TaxID=1387277 RepID=A0A916ZYU6_9RHOB|nr:helix-turn-helix domain-containing protein [Primorskyibacter flagellatus]GGE19370.1 transcriptional regulator [Primorskyibacter flagellatus]